MKVLVVEDDADVLTLLSKYLCMRGYAVFATRCAEEAFEVFRTEHTPLVIIDKVLPGMDGLELCRRMRASEDGGTSVILMITGHGCADQVSAVLDAGANDFLSKPFALQLLDVRLTIAERQFGEIQERKFVQDKLLHRALHDPLTDLPNRTLFWDRLHQAIRTAERDQSSVAVLLLDLDDFKNINDAFGHFVGDQVLEEVSARLADIGRASDTVARVGGDEFVLVLPGTGSSSAKAIARRVLHRVAEPLVIKRNKLSVGASVGIAVYPQHGSDTKAVVRHADAAMYRAKRSHVNHALYDAGKDAEWADRFSVRNEPEQGRNRATRSVF